MATPKTILALGEVLWDVFPDGAKFGGAPANFACACAGLGHRRVSVSLATAVGNDELGRLAVLRLTERGVDTTHVADSAHETGQVLVTLGEDKAATYQFIENPAWDQVPPSAGLSARAAAADVICFGTLGQRAAQSRDTIRGAVRTAPQSCLRILDINLRSPYWDREVIADSLALANVLKLNEEELPRVAGAVGLSGPEDDILRGLVSEYALRLVALTRGANGSVLLTATGERSESPGARVEVADTVGAGDAFTAVLALGLTHGLSLDTTHRWATAVAAFVCTKPGGTPTFPPELRLPDAGP